MSFHMVVSVLNQLSWISSYVQNVFIAKVKYTMASKSVHFFFCIGRVSDEFD